MAVGCLLFGVIGLITLISGKTGKGSVPVEGIQARLVGALILGAALYGIYLITRSTPVKKARSKKKRPGSE